mgnify:CR=1 FL=1
MHKINIETLRSDAVRQLRLTKELLQKAQEKGLIDAPAPNIKDRTTFDTKSLPEVLEVLDGEIHKLRDLDMVLAVVGTMKAGKSTSINAIVGAEVLPNRNRPMTALPTLIRHTPSVVRPQLRLLNVRPLNDLLGALGTTISATTPDALAELHRDADLARLLEKIQRKEHFSDFHEGEAQIFEILKSLNDLVRLCSALGMDFPFQDFATVDAMPVIEVEFSHLKNLPATQGRLTLLDTPGPNESGQQHLRSMLRDQLRKASAVLAVLDYTQLKSEADEQVRKSLMEIAHIAEGRMYALVNKFDQKDRHSDDAPTVKQYVAEKLMKGVLPGDSVFPVSSKLGYLASRARNEIQRHGELPRNEPWVEDFCSDALGMAWDDEAVSNKSLMQKAADGLWKKSGFAGPLEQVIVAAHQNAALEALRSAASKLDTYSGDARNFFNTNVGALKKSAVELQRNIDFLQKDIEDVTTIERATEKALSDALENMKNNVKSGVDGVRNDIRNTLKAYFREGKRIEYGNSIKTQESEPNASIKKDEGFLGGRGWLFFGGNKTNDRRISSENDFDPTSPIIKFDEKEEANDFIEKIEKSIRSILFKAEEEFKLSVDSGVDNFSKAFTHQHLESINKVKESIDRNISDFEIKIKFPDPRRIVMNTSVSAILDDAVEKKTKNVTRSRRQSGIWGTVCRWVDTEDWGWEDYEERKNYYQVDLDRISRSSNDGVEKFFDAAYLALEKDIHPQLQQGVEEYFCAFREKIEHVRGDLLAGITRHKLDQAKKNGILKDSEQLAQEASNLKADCEALNEAAETLREGEGVTAGQSGVPV